MSHEDSGVLPDLHSEVPNICIPVHSVGHVGVKRIVAIDEHDSAAMVVMDISVGLYAHQRGAHMSRLIECVAAADLIGRFQHRHLHTLFREGDGGSEPVGPAASHKRSGHATAPNRGSVEGRVHVTCNGIGPLGSQGCSATASVTFQVPHSVTPSAASMTL
jgi:Type I GTP cyclohydrolase folE2